MLREEDRPWREGPRHLMSYWSFMNLLTVSISVSSESIATIDGLTLHSGRASMVAMQESRNHTSIREWDEPGLLSIYSASGQ